jgi:atypical dual specificity phosphatase
MDKKELLPFLKNKISVEEKVDGANLGISITKDYKVIFQNRSHYVSSSTATQWKLLDDWVANHPGLWQVRLFL